MRRKAVTAEGLVQTAVQMLFPCSTAILASYKMKINVVFREAQTSQSSRTSRRGNASLTGMEVGAQRMMARPVSKATPFQNQL